MKPTRTQLILFFSSLLTSALWSLLPHVAGTSPLLALAIASAWYIQNPLLRVLIALLPAITNDMITGGHSTQLWVYISIACASLLSTAKPTTNTIVSTSIFSVFVFFISTNLGVFFTPISIQETL